MKLITYTLNSDGTIPEYIIDGGYLPVKNNNQSPQDFNFVGIVNDDFSSNGFMSEIELLNYAQDNNLTYRSFLTEEELPIETVVSFIWNKTLINN
jgi:hypothetical protein